MFYVELLLFFSCSGAVMAHQEEGPQMGQSSCRHPEHMEEVEGKKFCVVVPLLIKV